MAHRIYTFEAEETWPKHCSRCGHSWIVRRKFKGTGRSRRIAESSYARSASQFRVDGREKDIGITCPQCQKFRPEAMAEHFPEGVRVWIEEQFRRTQLTPFGARLQYWLAIGLPAILLVGWIASFPFQQPQFFWRQALAIMILVVITALASGLSRMILAIRRKTVRRIASDLTARILALSESEAEEFLARLSLVAPPIGVDPAEASTYFSRDNGDDIQGTASFLRRIFVAPLLVSNSLLSIVNTFIKRATTTVPTEAESQDQWKQFLNARQSGY